MLAAATLATLPGCAGPLAALADGGGTVCMTGASDVSVALATPLDIEGDATIRVTEVEAIDADGLSIANPLLVRVDRDDRLTTADYPPTEYYGSAWAEATPIADGEVEPGVPTDLVVEVRATNPDGGSLEGLRIRYEQEGWGFETRTSIRLEVEPGTSCTDADSDAG